MDSEDCKDIDNKTVDVLHIALLLWIMKFSVFKDTTAGKVFKIISKVKLFLLFF